MGMGGNHSNFFESVVLSILLEDLKLRSHDSGTFLKL